MGFVDGNADGENVGDNVGFHVGVFVGLLVGVAVGIRVGDVDGIREGAVDAANCRIWNSLNTVAHTMPMMMKLEEMFVILENLNAKQTEKFN